MSTHSRPDRKKITVNTFRERKRKGEKISVLTAYDAFVARLLDDAGIDSLLVGDSVGNVLHGFDSTIPVTMEMMLMHTAAVARGNRASLLVADMPFMSFQESPQQAVHNAGRFLKEAGAEAVKIEGGMEVVDTVRRVIDAGIPVMGHIGLTPQAIHRIGGHKVQGKAETSREYLLASARALEEAGCFSIVLELVESSVAADITNSLKRTATIGIGAGAACDGQVLVINDILGLRPSGFKPKFLREYANLSPAISDAAKQYIDDVRSGKYPDKAESYHSDTDN